MVSQIYPSELQLNKSDTEAAFVDLHLSMSNDISLPKVMINVTTVNFRFLDGNVPRCTSYGDYISKLIRFSTPPPIPVERSAYTDGILHV